MSGTPPAAQGAPAPSATTPVSSDAARRPATLDTSTAQRSARIHHRSTSSNVSIPELILTTDSNDTAGKAALNAPRPLTPSDHPGGSTQFPDMGASISSPGGSSGNNISRLQYNNITSVDFWNGLRDYLESRFMREDGSASPSASPGRVKGEAELVSAKRKKRRGKRCSSYSTLGLLSFLSNIQFKVFEDFLQSQKVHLSGE
jgi:hypothetical protein